MSYWLKNLFFCCFRRKSPNPFGSSSNESSTTVLAGAANPSKTITNTSSVGANTGAKTGASAQEAVSKNPFGTPEDSPEKGRLLKGIVNCFDLARSVHHG